MTKYKISRSANVAAVDISGKLKLAFEKGSIAAIYAVCILQIICIPNCMIFLYAVSSLLSTWDNEKIRVGKPYEVKRDTNDLHSSDHF